MLHKHEVKSILNKFYDEHLRKQCESILKFSADVRWGGMIARLRFAGVVSGSGESGRAIGSLLVDAEATAIAAASAPAAVSTAAKRRGSKIDSCF
ncbi:hypothetical protein V1478_007484 [Vespula squamosa]|uniref:Uncharacterized protein n=1 Tax=Vespula squamosa TaxID=30214 RepID=A0ABD2B3G6_VESSQ